MALEYSGAEAVRYLGARTSCVNSLSGVFISKDLKISKDRPLPEAVSFPVLPGPDIAGRIVPVESG